MKTIGKVAAVLLTIICAVFLGYAQERAPNTAVLAKEEKLPAHLRPSEYAVERAKEMGGEVFKLFSIDWGYDRGSSFGTYYSFKDRNYSSYQISFLRGELGVGGGWSYGFYTDLGEREFREIDRTSPEVEYFLSYKPPKLDLDIRSEIERLKDIKLDGLRLTRRVGVRAGNTYLLRSIDFYLADMAVVLHVLEISTDGSLTIVWKKLAEFERPRRLLMSDAELLSKVDAVLADLAIQDLRFSVNENYITFTGGSETNFNRVKAALSERNIRHCGIGHGKQATIRYC